MHAALYLKWIKSGHLASCVSLRLITGLDSPPGTWDWNMGLECGTGTWDWNVGQESLIVSIGHIIH